MPDPERSGHLQTAILWAAGAGVDGYGQPRVGSPVEVDVQWDDVQSEALDPQGNTITLDAKVRTLRAVPIGSRMWLGTLADWEATGSSEDPDGLMYVKTANVTPDTRNRMSEYSLGLMRFRQGPT